MNRSLLLAAVAVLMASIAAALWIRTQRNPTQRQEPAMGARVLATAGASSSRLRDTLPIPEPHVHEARTAEPEARVSRRVVDSPEARRQREFGLRYAGMSLEELLTQPREVKQRLSDATSAVFDDLHLHFDEHLAAKRYKAEVRREPFFVGEYRLGSADPCSTRTVILPDGSVEYHGVQFCPESEPPTAVLLEELRWLEITIAQIERNSRKP